MDIIMVLNSTETLKIDVLQSIFLLYDIVFFKYQYSCQKLYLFKYLNL